MNRHLVVGPVIRALLLRVGAIALVVLAGALPPQAALDATEELAREAANVDTSLNDLLAQPEVVARFAAALEPQRTDVTDLYFLGFAGDADDDVFMNLTLSAHALFDQRFGTSGRSLSLINNEATFYEYPLANAANLAAALSGVAARMDTDEDVLLLFMTSRGLPGPALAVDFWNLPGRDISPQMLVEMLDATSITWRVIIISACYSIGFVDALSGPNTLVIAASHAERKSVDCDGQDDFIHFGKAFLDKPQSRTTSLVHALTDAFPMIDAREADLGVLASSTQISIGLKIATKLSELE